MTKKRFKLFVGNNYGVQTMDGEVIFDSIISIADADVLVELLNELTKENEQLKEELNKLKKFEYGGEHIRLSINIETGELQRHIYATGQWFGDFDRVLCTNWISEEEYQRFIDRVIEVYNTEFKKELLE